VGPETHPRPEWGDGTATRVAAAGTCARIALAAIFAFGGPAATSAQEAPETVRLVFRPGSRLWLEGDSNLVSWTCEAKELAPDLRLERPAPDSPPTEVDRAVLDVPVAKIECGHRRMDENLRKALKAAAYPSIMFVVTGAEFFDTGVAGALEVLAKGHLYVAGIGRALQFQVSGTDTGNGALRLRGQVLIRMTDYGITPPTAMMGLLRTKDEVMIRFDLTTDYEQLADATS
jgi:hypothetical protein